MVEGFFTLRYGRAMSAVRCVGDTDIDGCSEITGGAKSATRSKYFRGTLVCRTPTSTPPSTCTCTWPTRVRRRVDPHTRPRRLFTLEQLASAGHGLHRLPDASDPLACLPEPARAALLAQLEEGGCPEYLATRGTAHLCEHACFARAHEPARTMHSLMMLVAAAGTTKDTTPDSVSLHTGTRLPYHRLLRPVRPRLVATLLHVFERKKKRNGCSYRRAVCVRMTQLA